MAYDLGTARGTIELEYEGRDAVDKVEKDMDRVNKDSDKTSKHVSRLGAVLRGTFTGVKIGAISVGILEAGVAAANLSVQLLGMVPQLTSILSLSSALPGAFLGGVAALGTLKAIVAGVGDTLKLAFDPKKTKQFNESLKNLSPSAQSFVKVMQQAGKPLKEYQKGIQEAFFSNAGLTQAIPQVLNALNRLNPAIQGVAKEFANVTRRVVAFATNGKSISFLKDSIDAFTRSLRNTSKGLEPILVGLRDVGGVGLPLLDRLSKAVGNVAATFGNWLSQIANSGQLQTWIETALNTLQTLGDIAKNVGSILLNVFKAAGETGGGLLDTISKVTGQFANFLNTAEGGAAIRTLFKGIGDAATALAPVVTTLVGALAGALGPALQKIATVLGPALLQVVEALSPALGPVADAIANVVTAVAPLLGPLAQLISLVAQLAAGILTNVAAELGPLIGLLGSGLSQVLQQLAPVIQEVLVQGLPLAAQAGLALLEAFKPLIPVLVQLAQTFAQAFIDNMPTILAAVQQLIPAITQFAAALAGNLGQSLQLIIPLIPTLVSAFVTFVSVFARVEAGLLKLYTAFVNFQTFVVNLVTGMPDRVKSAFSGLPGKIGDVIKNTAKTAAFLLGALIGTLVTIAVKAPGAIANAIRNLPTTISNVIRSAWNAAKSAFNTGVSVVVSVARGLPGKVKGALNSFVGAMKSIGTQAINGLVAGIKAGVGAVVSAAKSLGSSVLSGIKSTLKISSPSKEMIKIGRFVTQGLVKGMTADADTIKKTSTKLANYILDAFADKKITKGQRNSALKVLSGTTKTLTALANQSAAVATKLKAAQEKLADVQKAYNDVYNAAVEKTKATFSLVTSGQSFVNLDATKERFQDTVAQAKQFAKDIQTLAKRGLSKDLLQQLVDAGAADGGAMASALANASDATLKEFNNLQKQLNTAANSVGKTTADAMYGAGLQAAKGLVAGLEKQQKAIQKQMDRIADALVDRIKKALKIKSPSRVMFGLGKNTTQGLVLGLESLQRQVEKASENLATASILPTVQLTTSAASAQAQQAANSTTIGGNSYSVTQNVYALPGMSASQVAAYSLTKLRYGISAGVTAASLPTPTTAGV